MKLPFEIKEMICFYLNLDKLVQLYPRVVEKIFKKDNYIWGHAAVRGYLHIIKWLYNNDKMDGYNPGLIHSATSYNNFEIIKFLQKNIKSDYIHNKCLYTTSHYLKNLYNFHIKMSIIKSIEKGYIDITKFLCINNDLLDYDKNEIQKIFKEKYKKDISEFLNT